MGKKKSLPTVMKSNYARDFFSSFFKKTRCFAVPTFPTKVENVIQSCQEEVKTNLIDDLLFAGEFALTCSEQVVRMFAKSCLLH